MSFHGQRFHVGGMFFAGVWIMSSHVNSTALQTIINHTQLLIMLLIHVLHKQTFSRLVPNHPYKPKLISPTLSLDFLHFFLLIIWPSYYRGTTK